jgi:hypothetical protein
MTNPYNNPTLTGYDSSPPPDDGSEVESNRLEWAKHKDKHGDPLKSFSEAIDAAVSAAFDVIFLNSTVAKTADYTVTTADRGRLFLVSGSSTITLPKAADAGNGFAVAVKKTDSANTVTVDGDGTETLDGSTTRELNDQNETIILVSDGTNWRVAGTAASLSSEVRLSRGYIDGLTLELDADTAHDIKVNVGVARDAADGTNLSLTASFVKQIDANWAEGTAAGGFPSGLTLTADTWYHFFIIKKSDSTIDGGFDTSVTAANLLTDATSYTEYRRLGSVLTDSSSNITAFTQIGDFFQWDDPPLDVSGVAQSTTAVTRTMSCPPGGKFGLLLNAQIVANSTTHVRAFISSLDQTDAAPGSTAAPGASIGMQAPVGATGPDNTDGNMSVVAVFSNTSSQIRTRANGSCDLYIATIGYGDLRGRHA